MRGIGTIVNVLTILAGTATGVALGGRLTERLRSTVLQAVGLVTVVIGVQEALGTRNVVFPLVALVLGAGIGEAARIEDRLEAVGGAVRAWFRRGAAADDIQDRHDRHDRHDRRFAEGFVAASLLFCVGPLTILGSIRDGLGGPDHAQLLLVKAALDGVVSVAFAATLGWGVAASVLTVVVVQGGLTLAAGAADRVLTDRMVTELTATGGILVVGIGLRLLDVKKVPVASLLPALVLAPLGVALFAR
ncbi:MAG TPA: DUF554 domain-containing protein [Acidimicrobiales bacterium]|nr:DUF554 domain-containing protein [Acidimicrobiales bacterium]